MKNYPAVKSLLDNSANVTALPLVMAEWNMNRYVPLTVDNHGKPEEEFGYDVEMFPVESIVESPRPGKGINKARVNQSITAYNYTSNVDYQEGSQYYTADVDDVYKYWTSPIKTEGSGNFATPDVNPFVLYGRMVRINKVVIQTENSWASAENFEIQINTSSAEEAEDVWTTIADQADFDINNWGASGKLEVYWNGTTWTTTRPSHLAIASSNPTTLIRGIRLIVSSLTGGRRKNGEPTTYAVQNSSGSYVMAETTGNNSFFDLIEISARLECNLSQYVISVSDSFELSDISSVYPLGKVTQNQASLVLSNLYQDGAGDTQKGAFSVSIPEPDDTFVPTALLPWQPFIEANVKVNVSYQYFDDNFTTLIGDVQQFVMYVDEWSGQSEEEVQVSLTDHMKFFDEKPPPMLIEGATPGGVVARICDAMGFNNYRLNQATEQVGGEQTIPVFWTDGEKTLQEIFSDIATATQSAIFIDGYGRLNVNTRNFAFKMDTTPDFVLSDEPSAAVDERGFPEVLPNIVSTAIETQFDPNLFTVNYKKTEWAPENNGNPTMQKVWEPETSTVTLRSNRLTHPMKGAEGAFWIDSKEAAHWTYTGLVNIDGEIIEYDAKQFIYYTGVTGATKNTVWITTADEKSAKDKLSGNFKSKNYFTGAFRIKERGVWNSEQKDHSIDIAGWKSKARWKKTNGTYDVAHNVGGMKHNSSESKLWLKPGPGVPGANGALYAYHGSSSDSYYKYQGTKFQFIKGSANTVQRGGQVIFHNSSSNGYYIEFTPTTKLSTKDLATRNELTIYSVTSNGIPTTVIGKARAAIVEGVEYELDVFMSVSSGNIHTMQVWLNGKLLWRKNIETGRPAVGGVVALYARGKSEMKFEYAYAMQRDIVYPDDFSFMDKVKRAYVGDQWEREWVYSWKTRTRRVKKKSVKEKYRYSQFFFDDFCPYVHEIRKFDVKFDPNPVLHSRIYSTNDWASICLEYRPNPFGASFYMANTARYHAILNGEDKLTYAGSSSSINQVLNVYGRVLVISDAETVEKKNEQQIKARGKIESEIVSDWIQSKDHAEDIATWLEANWSYGNDTLELEVFGNPLIEVGDLVEINDYGKNIFATGWVVSVNNSFDEGLETTLTVRRKVA